MKRSEAILSLSEKLQKSQNLLDGYKNGSITLKCLCDNLATRAVDYCTGGLRMLPPPKEIDPVADFLIHCYYDKIDGKATEEGWVIDREKSQLWELEDEEK
jgi:hypothetical protein